MLQEKVKRSTIVFKEETVDVATEDVYENEGNNNAENVEDENQTTSDEENNKTDMSMEQINNLANELSKENSRDVENKSSKTKSNGISLMLLGEIMMGGEVTENLNYIYTSAFKNIYSITKACDFTYANFSTNITNLDKIEDAKSKYIVTKQVTSALKAIGLDAVSVASDHMLDFSDNIFNSTVNILEDSDIFVAGRKDTPVYFEKNQKKVALISTNAVILGTSKNYTKNDISVYDKNNLIKNIKEAKKSSDFVIVDCHYGREYTYGINDQMREIAYTAIDNGADLVIGSHALGVYPIVKYKDKPIIYSTGYLMSDSDLTAAKEGFLYKLNVSDDLKISSIEMTPIYIDSKKEVKLYTDYNLQKANSYLEMFNNWQVQNGLNSNIKNGKIVVEF